VNPPDHAPSESGQAAAWLTRPRSISLVGLSIKTLLTLGLGAFVLGKVELGTLWPILQDMGLGVALGTLALTVGSALVSAWRWHRVLVYLGQRVPVMLLFGDTLVGTTYNLFLPTSVGGDVARSLRCARRIRDPELAWASVMFERLVGLIGLALVSLLGLGCSVSTGTRPLLLVTLGLTIGLIALLLFAPVPLFWAARLGARISERFASLVDGLGRSFAGPLSRTLARVETLGWSLVYQAVALSVLLLPALGWHEPRLWEAVYLGVPIALIGAMAPVTVGGLGLRESLFVVVLEPFGVSAERALALALVWLGSNLIVGLLGGLVLLWGRR
jgi:uncharacterized membrane protein YbhN (UPF0104 family)